MLAPTFALTIGQLRSASDNPVAGPRQISIERDMDIAADGMRLYLMGRAGIALDDEVVIALGHDGANETVFTGNVVGLHPTIGEVQIQALGKMNALLNYRTSASFEDQNAGSIASDLIAAAGLSTGKVDAGPMLPHFTVDERASAFAHLKALADRLGYECYADRKGRIMFHALGPAAGLDAAAGVLPAAATGALVAAGGTDGTKGYAFGRHLLQAAADRHTPAWGSITVGGESPMSGQGDTTAHWLTVNDADYRGEAGDKTPGLRVIDPVARYKDLAERFAAGLLTVAAREAHQIHISVLGRSTLDLGDDIVVSEVADELSNGTGYIRAIRHRFDPEKGFVTDLRISAVRG
jgi:hypothetical protein